MGANESSLARDDDEVWPWWRRFGEQYEDHEKSRVKRLDYNEFGGDATVQGSDAMKAAAEASVNRGVTLEFLLNFTIQHNAWHLPTWRVVRDLVKPATSVTRCRYVELDEVKPFVGRADVFVSHAWAARWGVLILALYADEQSKNSSVRYWIDAFAVRQWPGNSADLDFSGVVTRCRAFVLVAESLEGVSELTQEQILAFGMRPSEEECKRIPFLRIWCLAEIAAAVDAKLPAFMLCGKLAETSLKFEYDNGTYNQKMQLMIDVEKAQAAFETDRVRILQDVRDAHGGPHLLNSMVFSSLFCGQGIFRCQPLRMHALDPKAKTLEAAIAEALEAQKAQTAPGTCYTLDQLLLLAATAGMTSACEQCLKAGADPNANLEGQQHPITAAALSGSSETVAALVAAGADIETKDALGRRPLNLAACFGLTNCVSQLLKLGAVVDDPEHPALAAACMNYQAESMELLLHAGADASRCHGDRGETVLHIVSQCQDRTRATKMVGQLLASAVDVNAKDCELYTPLMKAAQFGGAGAAVCLLEEGHADLNYATSRGATALLLACLNLRADCVEVLLRAGADLDATAGGRSAEDFAQSADEQKQIAQGEEEGCKNRVLGMLAWARLGRGGGPGVP